MKSIITRAAERGTADYGWLKPAHYFSFGGFHDNAKIRFGALRVLNDDLISGGGAFGRHPHENMEIITIPFSGALKHSDSTGGSGIIQAGDVQIMSAGTGVEHAEANASASDPVTLFQIWILPKQKNIAPRYDQRRFDAAAREGKWQTVVSPLEEDDALWINQDAKLSLTTVKAGSEIFYQNAFSGSGIYLVVINGSVRVNDLTLGIRDAAGFSETTSLQITAAENSDLLAIEVPMHA